MKTIQEPYGEIMANDDLKKDFVAAMKANKLDDFLKAYDCEATEEEVQEFLETKVASHTLTGLDDDQLKSVAGGTHPATFACSVNNSCACSDTCMADCC